MKCKYDILIISLTALFLLSHHPAYRKHKRMKTNFPVLRRLHVGNTGWRAVQIYAQICHKYIFKDISHLYS